MYYVGVECYSGATVLGKCGALPLFFVGIVSRGYGRIRAAARPSSLTVSDSLQPTADSGATDAQVPVPRGRGDPSTRPTRDATHRFAVSPRRGAD